MNGHDGFTYLSTATYTNNALDWGAAGMQVDSPFQLETRRWIRLENYETNGLPGFEEVTGCFVLQSMTACSTTLVRNCI